MFGVITVDPHSLEQSLRSASLAEVRLAPPQTNDFAMTGEAIAKFFRGLVSSRIGFEQTIAEVEKTRLLAEADQFFDDESRDTIRGIAAVLRRWAPRFASLRAPETQPLVLAFPTFFSAV